MSQSFAVKSFATFMKLGMFQTSSYDNELCVA